MPHVRSVDATQLDGSMMPGVPCTLQVWCAFGPDVRTAVWLVFRESMRALVLRGCICRTHETCQCGVGRNQMLIMIVLGSDCT